MLELNLPRQFNAAEYFVDRNVAEGRGNKSAIIHEDQQFTYEQVQEKVNRTANMLADLGVRMENRVMLLLRDTPEMIFSFYGAIKAGAVPIPSNILMKAPDFLYMLNDSRARVLIVDAVFLPEIEKIRSEAAFLKHVIVCNGEKHGYLDFADLLSQAGPEATAAATFVTANSAHKKLQTASTATDTNWAHAAATFILVIAKKQAASAVSRFIWN